MDDVLDDVHEAAAVRADVGAKRLLPKVKAMRSMWRSAWPRGAREMLIGMTSSTLKMMAWPTMVSTSV